MKLFLYTSIAAILISSTSCRKGSMWGIRGEGDNVTESRSPGNFSGIDLSMGADVTYVSDSICRLEVTGQQNILTILETKVEGGILKMDFRRNVWHHNRLQLVVHSPVMNSMTMSGDGSINANSNMSGTDLNLQLSGSGNISIASLTLQSLHANISGSGNISINGGSCGSSYLTTSGNGKIYSEWLISNSVSAHISGNGDITLTALQTLNVDISGNGKVSYHGHPVVTSNISGPGKIVALD